MARGSKAPPRAAVRARVSAPAQSRRSTGRRGAVPVLAVGLLATSAQADSRLVCDAPLDASLPVFDPATVFPDKDAAPPGALQFSSGSADIVLGGGGSLSGGVMVKRDDDFLVAERADYDPQQQRLTLSGNVQYSGLASVVQGEGAEFDYGSGRISFTESRFALPEGRGRGDARSFELNQAGQIRLEDVAYTSCPVGRDDWEMKAGRIRLDTASGIGTARNLRLDFQGVPILWAPYLSFPISDARKTGFLLPNFGTSGSNGTDINVPYYWNLAPNYDATLTPRLLSKRGIQLNTEFRYLMRLTEGLFDVAFLPNDNEIGESRTFATIENTSYLWRGWRLTLDAQHVSDENYFEDLGESQSSASTTFLDRRMVLERPGKHWDFLFRAQAFQTLDETIAATDEPYRRLPQLIANGRWPGLTAGLDLNISNELTHFERDTGVTGWRYHASPALSRRLSWRGSYLTPELAYHYTAYRLQDTATGSDESPDRALPSFSVDAGTVFERTVGTDRGWLQTLEPRVLFVHTPFRNQNDLPVFDTILPDFNLIQIFRKRPLIGIDRMLDVDQVSLGVTSRIIQSTTGRALLSATIGQTRFLSEQGVTLPDSPSRGGGSSDYIAELDINLYENWNLEFGHQWNSGNNETVKSEFRLQYQPEQNKILNLAYRFRRDSLEQADVSFSWPLGARWNMVGRYNYSFRDETTLEYFVGLEYESCCWAARVVSRRYIRRRDGTADSSIALQLELKGLTSVGDPAGKRLERGILGYESD